MTSARWPGRSLPVLVAVAGVLGAAPARGQQIPEACASAFVDAQVLLKETKCIEAEPRALSCAMPACGKTLSSECSKLYDAILAATPSVVFGAKDADGGDLVDVSVFVDGKLAQEKLEGKPVRMNPGAHLVRFEGKGLPTIEKSYTVRLGEQLRFVTETLGEKKQPIAPPAALAAVPPPPSWPSRRWLRTGTLVSGAVGVVGFGAFIAFHQVGMGEYNTLASKCSAPPHCARALVDDNPSHGMLTASVVALGVGIAGAASAGVFTALTVGKGDGPVLQLTPTTTGLGVNFKATF